MERSDTLTLGTLAHFRHFRHFQLLNLICGFETTSKVLVLCSFHQADGGSYQADRYSLYQS